MGDFEFFDNWNKVIRWILFIPMLIVAYTITFLFGKYAFWYAFGWMGIGEDTIIGFVTLHFYLSFICFCVPFQVSVACAPRGKLIIASVYLGLVILLLGFSTFSLLTYGDGRPLWQSIYDYSLNLAGATLALISVVAQESQRKKEVLVNNTIEA